MPRGGDPSGGGPGRGDRVGLRTRLARLLRPLLVRAWPHERGSRVLSAYLLATIVLFLAGLAAWEAEAYGFLKLYPFQLAVSMPLLVFFIFCLAHIKVAPAAGRGLRAVWIAALVACVCLVDARDVTEAAAAAPVSFAKRVGRLASRGVRRKGDDRLYAWIREATPTDSVFITPMRGEFWAYAERAQVAQFHHPPLDERLVTIRDRFGATHYLASVERPELKRHLAFSVDEWYVYALGKL